MIKLIITILLPLFGPMIAYSLWQRLILQRGHFGLRRQTLAWCLIAGVILVTLSLFVFGLQTTSKTPGAYNPPSLKDGQVVPGDFDY